eukprot:CAMPEP_0173408024 /NCGR_PEP_ID=MMETSP1356-20130122/68628_1 /TAXON_ID=77927 ORGANISM="Hemiselmis virescens, Strain PCC157" /NCGR_SAMPLE_ID=MMETSP1356 /ASSEMBLY_ACC=CAM_ASM_000847 /LENGTH=123 /DNA_ID=CAMNT_0014369263 /DNA_START=314 /DNA_END=685 /DNA_ORIENTATION=+
MQNCQSFEGTRIQHLPLSWVTRSREACGAAAWAWARNRLLDRDILLDGSADCATYHGTPVARPVWCRGAWDEEAPHRGPCDDAPDAPDGKPPDTLLARARMPWTVATCAHQMPTTHSWALRTE